MLHSRRHFLRVGAVPLGGLSLPRILRAREEATKRGAQPRATSVIFLELAGGPSQFETYDPKPAAPLECRGPFGVVRTKLPGIVFSELMAEQAKMADRLAIVRTVTHPSNSHDPSSHLSMTGYYKTGPKGGPNQTPCIGSVTAKVIGPQHPQMPAYVAVPGVMRNGRAAFLGPGFDPFVVDDDPNKEDFRVQNLEPFEGLSEDRYVGRLSLADRLDGMRRIVDDRGVTEAMDRFTLHALDLITGERARRAFDVAREEDAVRQRYGRNTVGQSMLLARRLVEAGVTFVSVRVTGWDDHVDLTQRMREKGPNFDRGVAALVSDLYQRGLERDVLVVAIGEFGRTPHMNEKAGRDHWGALMSVLFAGGGLQVGQVIGRSNSKGERPIEAPYRPENVLAMIYRHLGIDPSMMFEDLSGRPRHLLEERRLITELL